MNIWKGFKKLFTGGGVDEDFMELNKDIDDLTEDFKKEAKDINEGLNKDLNEALARASASSPYEKTVIKFKEKTTVKKKFSDGGGFKLSGGSGGQGLIFYSSNPGAKSGDAPYPTGTTYGGMVPEYSQEFLKDSHELNPEVEYDYYSVDLPKNELSVVGSRNSFCSVTLHIDSLTKNVLSTGYGHTLIGFGRWITNRFGGDAINVFRLTCFSYCKDADRYIYNGEKTCKLVHYINNKDGLHVYCLGCKDNDVYVHWSFRMVDDKIMLYEVAFIEHIDEKWILLKKFTGSEFLKIKFERVKNVN